MPRLAAPSSTFACLTALVAGGQAFAHGPDHDPAPAPQPAPDPAAAPTQFDTGAGALQPGPARLCSLAAPVW